MHRRFRFFVPAALLGLSLASRMGGQGAEVRDAHASAGNPSISRRLEWSESS